MHCELKELLSLPPYMAPSPWSGNPKASPLPQPCMTGIRSQIYIVFQSVPKSGRKKQTSFPPFLNTNPQILDEKCFFPFLLLISPLYNCVTWPQGVPRCSIFWQCRTRPSGARRCQAMLGDARRFQLFGPEDYTCLSRWVCGLGVGSVRRYTGACAKQDRTQRCAVCACAVCADLPPARPPAPTGPEALSPPHVPRARLPFLLFFPQTPNSRVFFSISNLQGG